jgi:REP element-mobilizing transposase RayT
MGVPVLIVTPTAGFGELIGQTLKETGHYDAILVQDGDQAIERARSSQFAVAILDFDHTVVKSGDLFTALRAAREDIKIIAIPPDNDVKSPELIKYAPDGTLTKPFYLPDLLDTLGELVGGPVGHAKQPISEAPFLGDQRPVFMGSKSGAPEWLQDVQRAAQYLTRLSLESAAQAALITLSDQLWAYAGELPQLAAEELVGLVAHYWANDGGSDLTRFVRLGATGGEYMLYATGLGGDYVLTLVFQTEMPFSVIRAQAGELARRLSTTPPEQDDVVSDVSSGVGDQSDALIYSALGEIVPDEERLTEISADWRLEQDMLEHQQAMIDDLLSTLDVPDPGGAEASPGGAFVPSINIEEEMFSLEEAVAADEASPQITNQPDSNEQPLKTLDEKVSSFDHQPDLVFSSIGSRSNPPNVLNRGGENPPESLVDGNFEPVSSAWHNLTYGCLLIPRLSQHNLVGDLAEHVTQWVTQLCIAFGWRLDHLSVRPEYLYWVVGVSPDFSPGRMVRDLRQHTSERIFAQHPELARDNPSGDFWAPGYLITNGRRPLVSKLIQDFILQARTRQGNFQR